MCPKRIDYYFRFKKCIKRPKPLVLEEKKNFFFGAIWNILRII